MNLTNRPAAQHTTPALAFEGVALGFGTHTILDHIDFTIGAGEFVGVLGPNGAGKTTLMRALLGLVKPRAGQIRVFGAPASRGNPALAYMPQTRSALGEKRISGRDFVACASDGQRFGLPWRNAAARDAVAAALDAVGASALAARPLAEMSGGERQRLLLAQCLLGEPRLLLLDEPLISLDPRRQQEIVDLIRDIARARGITVLFSAHELNPLLGALDRVMYLGAGRAALGTVDEVITGPVLSALYQAPIDVLRVGGRIFVMSGQHDMERDAHRHDHGHGHDAAHDHADGHAHSAQRPAPTAHAHGHPDV